MSLPERPGLLHAIPVCNLLLIMWLLSWFSAGLVRQSGVKVEMSPSQFQLERYRETYVITLGAGEGTPRIHFGRDAVTMEELQLRLKEVFTNSNRAETIVLLRTDAGTPVGVERKVSEMVLGMGLRLGLLGTEAPPAEPVQPSNPPR